MIKRLLTIALACSAICMTALGEIHETDFTFEGITFEPQELQLDMTSEQEAPLQLVESTHSFSQSQAASWPSSNVSENGEVKPYRFMDDMSFAGVPLFVAGMIAKAEKKGFRQDYNNANKKLRLVSHFKTTVDNYTQYAPAAATAIMNLAGVKGRSNFGRMAASSAMSYVVMAALVNGIKYTSKEMRPDGSTANSWPSGHTATAFTAATIMHKEYGMTVSPWYSVAAYTTATATGAMRVLNNRHWVSDVLSGAGIGILSGELGYALCDLIFKGKGLNMNDLSYYPDINADPSFFSVSMGIGIDNHKNLTFVYDNSLGEGLDMREVTIKFRNSTVLGVEGAYFFNKYVGVGGRLKIRTTPVGNFPDVAQSMYDGLESAITDFYPDTKNLITDATFDIESDHLTEFIASMGPFFNIPLGSRFALGTKLLAGHSTTNALDIDAHYIGKVYHNYTEETDDSYDVTWDAFSIEANNTFSWGTGVSLTFAYKSNFSWRAFVDFDHTRKTFTMRYLEEGFINDAFPDYPTNLEDGLVTASLKRNMSTFTLGGAFVISF